MLNSSWLCCYGMQKFTLNLDVDQNVRPLLEWLKQQTVGRDGMVQWILPELETLILRGDDFGGVELLAVVRARYRRRRSNDTSHNQLST